VIIILNGSLLLFVDHYVLYKFGLWQSVLSSESSKKKYVKSLRIWDSNTDARETSCPADTPNAVNVKLIQGLSVQY